MRDQAARCTKALDATGLAAAECRGWGAYRPPPANQQPEATMDQDWQERWHRPIPEPRLDPPEDDPEEEEEPEDEYDEEPDEEELQENLARWRRDREE